MAAELSAQLTAITVLPDTRVSPAMGEPSRFADEQREAFRTALDNSLQGIDLSPAARTELLEGPVVDTLADLRSEDYDVLVCGSRGYGPARSVLLGGVSSRLLRHARLPVVVVPRG